METKLSLISLDAVEKWNINKTLKQEKEKQHNLYKKASSTIPKLNV